MEEKRPFNMGPIYMIITGVLFSIGGLLLKVVPWGAIPTNSFRCLLAGFVILIYMKLTGKKICWSRSVAIGAATICLTTYLYTFAVKQTTAGAAIVIQFTVPIWTTLFTLLLFHRKPRKGDIVACIAVFTGIAVCFYEGLAAGRTLGNFLALLSGITYSGVFMSRQAKDSDPVSSTLFGNFASAVIGLPFLFKEDFSALTAVSWLSLIVLGVVQMGLAYVFMTKGLETTPPVVACLLTGLEPVLNPIWVALFYNEPITLLFAIGGTIVLVSITMYQIWNMKSEPSP